MQSILLSGRESRAVLGEFVSLEEGTGIVHIAPGHGEDDYKTGLKYGLDIYAPVDDKGKFTRAVPELEGQFVFKASTQIIEILKSKNALIKEEKITHSYPHCWRCKKPVIFRATEQWFISVEHNNLRGNALKRLIRSTGFLNGAETGYTTWFQAGLIGAYQDRGHGECR